MPATLPKSFPLSAALLSAALCGLSSPAAAEDVGALPLDTPASYRSECGSCHTAFPPGLLARGDWRDIMDGLARHFGDNAALADATHREIEDFLTRNAGGSRRFGSRGEPPRVSTTPWFRRTHGIIRPAFRDPRVGSAANCEACHPDADAGRYRRLAPLVQRLEHKK